MVSKIENEIVKTLQHMQQALGTFVIDYEKNIENQNQQIEVRNKYLEKLETEISNLKNVLDENEKNENVQKNISHLFSHAKGYTTLIVFGLYATFFSLWWSLGQAGLPENFKKAGLCLIISAVLFGFFEIFKVFYESAKFLVSNFNLTRKTLQEVQEAEPKPKIFPFPLGAWMFGLFWLIIWLGTVGFGGFGIFLMAEDLVRSLLP